jgi:hypothetical protein
MSRFGVNVLSMLRLCLDVFFAFGPKAEYHCECLVYVAFMGEHKLLFAAKALHVPCNELILKRGVYA